ncbi:2Fe-2S iron-sulfur cluster-binding protein [Ramlibacter tataouinensis]|uniref:2Fe-2S iron-sulfur cluster-binding protein n=1 Tax=Ramlibacter tataouinensis TaxID=94132 RepID=UPI0022F40405|nr:2Fe-2S iron-sulfur cluster-binding protein [Ramlibacter tataouinensis]WBY03070.1 2Fe-2S iron-sulfur cluster-binding protein [Ramlibacter tataouinensis]
MPTVHFIDPQGAEHAVDAPVGKSLMQAALDHSVPGILGDCGGACSCATCHGYVDPAFLDRLPPRSETEVFMLEGVPDLRDNSRLCCQIRMNAELAGIRVQLPDEQV